MAVCAPTVAGRAHSYGLRGLQNDDANDVLAIHEVAGEAIRRARNGEGPTLIECCTYRTRAHAEGMGDFTYRTREEVEQWKARCPILRLKNYLLEQAVSLENELNELEAAVAAEGNGPGFVVGERVV